MNMVVIKCLCLMSEYEQFGHLGLVVTEQKHSPACIAVDDTYNIYVSSEHKLQKFTSSELIKCIGGGAVRRRSLEIHVESPSTAIKFTYLTEITIAFKCLTWT